MPQLIFINSSSKANAALVIKGGCGLLIDCGCSVRALKTTLAGHGLGIETIKAVLVTHSHSDHTKALPLLKRTLDVPFYSAVDIDCCQKPDPNLTVGEFSITSFELSHDVPCVGYRIEFGNDSVVFATDTGIITDAARSAFEGAGTLVLESNHDLSMLRYGPYPPQLKARILSDNGHLSNDDCAKELVRLAAAGSLKRAVLAHLSEHNNTPLVARKTAEQALSRYGFDSISVLTASPGLKIEI